MQRETHFSIWYFIAALLVVVWLHGVWTEYRTVEPISYSEFQTYLKEGRIAEIAVRENSVEGKFKSPLPDGRTRFVAIRVEPDLARDLEKYDVKFSGVVQSTFLRDILSWVLPALVFFGLWFYLMRRFAEKQGLGSGFLTIGKSKAKIYMESDTRVTFDDVAGVDETKEELQEVIGFLKDPGRYSRLGGRVPKVTEDTLDVSQN